MREEAHLLVNIILANPMMVIYIKDISSLIREIRDFTGRVLVAKNLDDYYEIESPYGDYWERKRRNRKKWSVYIQEQDEFNSNF